MPALSVPPSRERFGRRWREAARRRKRALRRLAQCYVARNDNDGNPAQADRRANRVLQDVRQLARVGNEFAVVAAFAKEILRMRLLEIASADLGGGNLGGNREHRNPASVSVEQSIDEMQIAWSAGARTGSQFTGHLCVAGRG